jgi:hypothetical protein
VVSAADPLRPKSQLSGPEVFPLKFLSIYVKGKFKPY